MPIELLLNRGLISKNTYSVNVKHTRGNQQHENNQKKSHILLAMETQFYFFIL